MKRIGRYTGRVLCGVPFLAGTVGLILSGDRPIDAAFKAATMYVLNYGDVPANLLTEIGRWGALIVTIGVVLAAFMKGWSWLRAFYGRLFRNSVAVYGDAELARALKQEGIFTVVGEQGLVPACRYILAGEEEESLAWLGCRAEQLKGKEVYLRCDSLRGRVETRGRVHLYAAEEIGARMFWKQAGLYEEYLKKDRDLSIVLLGFGNLGRQVLLAGLQYNIFSPRQHFTYHVFGSDGSFEQLHHELDKLEDSVVFHSESWQMAIRTLDADRIIVCEQEQQRKLISDLLFMLPGVRPDVLTASSELDETMEQRDRCRCFDWKAASQSCESIFRASTLQRAKLVNIRYEMLYGQAKSEDEMEECWRRLDSFTRQSNISCADYHSVREAMLEHWHATGGFDSLPDDKKEMLAELEHMRWCRFHYLNNWSWAKLPTGVRKDSERRLHADLVPYSKLPKEEQTKDFETVRTLMGFLA